jgi:hypothetical protein
VVRKTISRFALLAPICLFLFSIFKVYIEVIRTVLNSVLAVTNPTLKILTRNFNLLNYYIVQYEE